MEHASCDQNVIASPCFIFLLFSTSKQIHDYSEWGGPTPDRMVKGIYFIWVATGQL